MGGAFAEGLLEGAALAEGAGAPGAPGYAPGEGGLARGTASEPRGDVSGGVPGLDPGLQCMHHRVSCISKLMIDHDHQAIPGRHARWLIMSNPGIFGF